MEWLCIDFLNSDWRDWRGSGRSENRLEKQEWQQYLLQQWGLDAPVPADERSYIELLQLREQMRSMVERVVAGESLCPQDLHVLNKAMALAPSYPHIVAEEKENRYRLEHVSAVAGWPFVMARIAESFVDLLAHHDLRRIKLCANTDCLWVYFDESRNRTRRWCDDKMCGNLIKVRRFRERQKVGESDE